MTYGDFKDLPRRKVANKVLPDKVFIIAKNPKYDGYQRRFSSMVYNYFNKSLQAVLLKWKMPNQQLAEELHKRIIKKFEKPKIHLSFTDNIWGADLADMDVISKFNRGFWYYYALFIFIGNVHCLLL